MLIWQNMVPGWRKHKGTVLVSKILFWKKKIKKESVLVINRSGNSNLVLFTWVGPKTPIGIRKLLGAPNNIAGVPSNF